MNHLAELVKEQLEPEETVMINGTSIEVALELLQKGRLLGERFIAYVHYQGYVFFAPNAQHFEDFTLSDGSFVDNVRCTWDYALGDARRYAELVAFRHYMIDKLGCKPDSLGEVTPPVTMDGAYDIFYNEMREKGFKPETLSQFLRNASERRGVLIGVNRQIFERKIEPYKDSIGEVRIYAPEGIESKYLNAIVPCGNIEKQILSEFCSKQIKD